MMLLGGLATAILVWWALKFIGLTQPAQLAKLVRKAGGAAALAVAGLLAFRGRIDMAMLVGGAGAWLLGWSSLPAPFGGATTAAPPRPGAKSTVRSATIEMSLDHDTGRMSGSVLSGPSAGRTLDALPDDEVVRLWTESLSGDVEGARLIEAYLDRRLPGWREHAQPDPNGRRQPDTKLATMSKQEAYEVLGLETGAGADEIRAAHRSLMKKLHPDQGGSTYLASRVNQAKDVLLDRHR